MTPNWKFASDRNACERVSPEKYSVIQSMEILVVSRSITIFLESIILNYVRVCTICTYIL